MKLLHVFRGLLLLLAVLVFGACGTASIETPVALPKERVALVMVPVCGVPTVLAEAATWKSADVVWGGGRTITGFASKAGCTFLGRLRVGE